MLTVLFCLARIFLPGGITVAEIEVQAVALTLGLFAFISRRLWLNSRSRGSPEQPESPK